MAEARVPRPRSSIGLTSSLAYDWLTDVLAGPAWTKD